METVEFYGGVDEIGGNKIKVNVDSTSLMLDFGMSFSKNGMYFDNFVNPRKSNGIGDYIELGLIPKIKGIYREDYIRHMGLNFEEKPSIDGLLLSHAHADHADYMTLLRNDIPFYMSQNSKVILEVLDTTGTKELYRYKEQFKFVPKKRGEGFKQAIGDEISSPRDIRVLKPYKRETIGNLDVQLAPVDHSLPGASAFLIEGSQEKIVYTGDLRFHGRNRDATFEFVEKAKKFQPDIMICEGTRINSGLHKKSHDENGEEIKYLELEEEIEDKAYDLISQYNGLVVVNFPLRDLDRLVTFYNLAKNTDRKLAISLKQAYMLKRIEEENSEKTIYPSIHDEAISIYLPRRGSGLYMKDNYVNYGGHWQAANETDRIKDYSKDKWILEFLEYDNAITYKDIQENESDYIFRCDNFSFVDLIDVKPENAIYIHSTTEPFNEEMEMSYEITENWLNHFEIPIYNHFHVSGHARGDELLEMIREIQPDVLYPVHTEHAEMYDILKEDGIEVIRPSLKGC